MGRSGKDKIPFHWAAWLALGSALTLGGCAAGGERDGRYAGTVTTDTGLCGLASGTRPAVGALLIRRAEVEFAPDEGVIVLHGRVDETGHVVASATTLGADHKPFVMAFEGDLRGNHVEGRYATPRCRAVVKLDRVS
jgi:hypothetical protein